jgi:uncharacterized protein (DUF1499 family)
VQFLTYLNLFLIIFGPIGSHFRWLSPIFGFSLFSIGVLLSAILFFPALVGFFRWGFRDAKKLTIFMGILSLAAIGFTVKLSIENPLNDVSTDANRPPVFGHDTYRFNVPEGFIGSDTQYLFDKSYSLNSAAELPIVYPQLKPIVVEEPPQAVIQKLETSLKQLPPDWKIVFANKQAPLSIELEYESELFRFVDDVVVEVRPNLMGPGSEIHIRSKSRYGKSDLGANIKKIQVLLARLSGSLR